MNKRQKRIYKSIENPKKLSDYIIVEDPNYMKDKKMNKHAFKYRFFIPLLLLIAVTLTITMTVIFL